MGKKLNVQVELEASFTADGLDVYAYLDDSPDSEEVMAIDWDSLFSVTSDCSYDCAELAEVANNLEVFVDRIREYILST